MQEHDYCEDDKVESYQEAQPLPRIENIFCVRCGSKLKLSSIDTTTLVEYYTCTKEGCVHSKCMLEFKHPVYENRGPGESYALCWIK